MECLTVVSNISIIYTQYMNVLNSNQVQKSPDPGEHPHTETGPRLLVKSEFNFKYFIKTTCSK